MLYNICFIIINIIIYIFGIHVTSYIFNIIINNNIINSSSSSSYTQLTLDEVQLYSYQLLKGLHHMHNRQVVHMNLQPSNIMIDKKTEYLKIIDFDQSIMKLTGGDDGLSLLLSLSSCMFTLLPPSISSSSS